MKKGYPQLNAWSKAHNGSFKQPNSEIIIKKNNRPSKKRLTDIRRDRLGNDEKRR